MVNYDGLLEVRISYTTQPNGMLPLSHKLTFDVISGVIPAVGTPFANIEVETRGGALVELDTFVTNFVTIVADFYATGDSFDFAELYYIPEGTFDATWISAFTLGINGTVGGFSTPAHQDTLTFRTLGGGTGRIQLMETIATGNQKIANPTGNAIVDDIFAYMTEATTAIVGRDNTHAIVGINWSSGQNERLWRKRYRS